MEKQNRPLGRYLFCILFLTVIFGLYLYRLYDWQIVNGDTWLTTADNSTQSTVAITAARGEILDVNGEPLAVNRTGYAIVLDWAYMRLDTMDETVKQENETIHQIITLLDEKGEEWTDILPIAWENGEYVFLPDMDKEIETLKGRDYADVNSYASAQLCMDSLIAKYEVEGYSPEETRDIVSVRYSMTKNQFGISHPYTMAEDVSLEIAAGTSTAIVGQTGSGKSTLIRTLCGFQPPLRGSVTVKGRGIETFSPHEFALTVGVVLTDRTNAGGLTVRELVSLGRQPHTGFFGRLGERDRRVVSEAMSAVGVAHKADSYVSELSDGERQRAMIAKALAQECPLIVLDEPTAFLDVASRIETMELLHRTAREQGKAILLSTHDIDNALMYSDRLLLLSSGTAVVAGAPEDLVLDGSLGEFFGRRGMNFDLRSGRLSTGVSGPEVGVDGDGLTARWMANALARNGFTPVLPAAGLPCVHCVSAVCLEVTAAGGVEPVTVQSISRAVSLLADDI